MNHLELVLWIVSGLFANQFIGIIAFATMDNEDLELLAWMEDAPGYWLQVLVLQCWPVFVAIYLWRWWQDGTRPLVRSDAHRSTEPQVPGVHGAASNLEQSERQIPVSVRPDQQET